MTNGPSDGQRDKLEAVGIDGMFASVVISGEIGVAKPDPTPFMRAAAELGVEPESMWHIGDSLAPTLRALALRGLSRYGSTAPTGHWTGRRDPTSRFVPWVTSPDA